jgi:hypothetical protein
MPRSQAVLGGTGDIIVNISPCRWNALRISSTLICGIGPMAALNVIGIIASNIAGDSSDLMRRVRERTGRVSDILGGIRCRLRCKRGVAILAVIGRIPMLMVPCHRGQMKNDHNDFLLFPTESMMRRPSQAAGKERVGPGLTAVGRGSCAIGKTPVDD